MSFEEKLEYASKRLTRLQELKNMEMGTQAAEELWESRLSFYTVFYDKLISQLECSRGIINRDLP